MKIHILLWHFEFCALTRHYSPSHDEFLKANVSVRIGKHVWSARKGYTRIRV